MSDPLQTAWLRLERAEAHINDIEAEIVAFFQANPCSMTSHEHVNEAGETWYVVKIAPTKLFPKMLPAMISDAAANLRAPLDYAVCRVFDAIPHPDVDGNRLMFPIAKTPEGFASVMNQRKIATFSPELADIIRAAEPYEGGNDYLFALHHLARKERHVDLAEIGMMRGSRSGSITVGPGGIAYLHIPDDGWHLLDHAIPVASFSVPDFEVRLEIPLQVSICKPDAFLGQPVALALRNSSAAVKGLLLEIDKRFFK
jgi:hypothetical protein